MSTGTWRLLGATFCPLLFVGVFVRSSAASPIDYGNFPAPDVTYDQVTEDSATSPTPLYGPPITSGDALVFSPTHFAATGSNGGVEITDGTLTTTILANDSQGIQNVVVSEAGDYTLAGSPAATSTSVSVAAPVFLQIVQVNGVGITPIDLDGNLVFTPSNGSYNLLDNPGAGVIWTGTLNLNVNAALAANNITGGATEILYVMDNDLTAISQTGTIAFIEKKNSGGVSITASVPEPVSTSMIALVSFGILGRRHRSRK